MNTDIEQMLDLMDRTFRDFESSMPSKPQFVKLSFGMAYRFQEKDIYQAMIQKLASVQSAVRAAQLLLKNGFFQEQSVLQRTIDDTNEDIAFLVYAVTNDTITDLHKRFLKAFWEEEIDESGTLFSSAQKRDMIPRKKIRAYIARVDGVDSDIDTHLEMVRSISKAYSGFVHGASPQIMNMYIGTPPHFHTKGMLGTPKVEAHSDDLWNYVYRTYLSHMLVAKALGANEHFDILNKQLKGFQENHGMYL